MIIKKNEQKILKTNFNISLSILRMYLCFVIVNNHLFISKLYFRYIILLRNSIAVPIFFIMSFFLCYKIFLFNDYLKIKNRFERLLIPYFVWPFITWLINIFFYYYLNIKFKICFYDLLIQFISGHNFVTVLWFQFDLIFNTFLIFFVQKSFSKNIFFILINIEIISFILQYSFISYQLFSQFSFYFRYPLGRLNESLPFTITGYILGYLDIIKYLKKFRKSILYFNTLILIIILKYNIFISIKGFNCQGIRLYVISIIIFICFALNPFENIINSTSLKIIKIFTNYTSGIYYLHYTIYNYLSKFINLIRTKTIFTSIIIYIICYIISFIGIKIFGKTKLKHLFQ